MTKEEILKLKDKDVVVFHAFQNGNEFYDDLAVFGKPALSEDGEKLILCPKYNSNIIDVKMAGYWSLPTPDLIAGYACSFAMRMDKPYPEGYKKCLSNHIREMVETMIRHMK
jgi:hypothetical protein